MNPSTNTPMRLGQPGTPVVVPPTPSSSTAAAGPSSSATPTTAGSPTTSQPQYDVFYDPAEDNTERQTNRRSIYRSPGTSSSPDLATLLRKTKERGGTINAQQYRNLKEREKRREDPAPPLPPHDRASSANSPPGVTGRQRSSTNTSPGHPMSSSYSLKSDGRSGKGKDDWMPSSPRVRETGTLKVSVKVWLHATRSLSGCVFFSRKRVPCALSGARC